MWDASGENLVERLAGVEGYTLALATYRAAVERWPGGTITLRQGARSSRTAGGRERPSRWPDEGRRGGR
jgi:hypothetical protein